MTSKKDMDRVCGMWIETSEAKFISYYNGQTYYFCASECKDKFDQNPAFYMKGFEGRNP
ncbi:MAG: YHS domain-containing protein [Nitrospirales bacterium]|nr:MAG: YHS domain-containing protein [Nitrospirales bacterium]